MSQNQKRNLLILFVDDEENSVKYFQKAFGNHFNIIATTDLDEAWDIFKKRNSEIAAVISDQRMPKGSGIEFLVRVKGENRDIIRIITTAYANLEDSIGAINKSNVFAYLTKPWNFEEVHDTLNRALEQFENRKNYLALSGFIAHEMRNPLHAVKQSTDLIRQKLAVANLNERYCCNSTSNEKVTPLTRNDFDEIISYLGITNSSANRGNVIIDMILGSIRQKPINVGDFKNIAASEMLKIAMLEYSFTEDEKKRVKIEIKPEDDFNIRCDKILLSYVFFNLFRNSFFYLKSHPDLKITIRAESNRDDYNKIYFRDNGPGISANNLPHLFEAFSTYGKEEGTGLGLAFCKKTMENFDGAISCNSKQGEFSEFTLAFPKNIEAKQVNHILLVDDQETTLLITKKLLEDNLESVCCDMAKNGIEALKMLKERDYKIILMDIEMPEMDGIAAAKAIREFDLATPIVAYSSKNLRLVIESLKKSQFSAYVAKTNAANIMIRTIFKWSAIKIKNPLIDKEETKKILENKNILLVDDDSANLALTAKFLRNHKVKVDEAKNGQEALQMNKDKAYDAIVMDIEMPEINGIMAVKEIRKLQRQNNLKLIPIIAFTGDNDDEKIIRILNAGFDDYFMKGEDPSQLLETISIWNEVDRDGLIDF
ncbi:MAG: hypothetical protein A2887_03045 [Alphaproteobacteria bacterium RIFCSPLOWO2_01_FULL_40_26]|nr:MAG: hypothetical protein A3D15_05635 [Alphaproteobacteria bacterium RIFCSPHIGHO2_02_FULL_40_34]OFW86964.1 MAG: hypothetical protein A2794_01295 [Alphaproteobacteria bacterium RIFCSPHIGHO2_01_FULL_40_8]OFW95500.1 MAG: hypothetical protein A2887_03045 [Alphaproteobacteria bacterium RIFCSPLOWO2_01_FULL_40_26]OFX09320.1 MAG: hypothetical protein A3H30_01285 [Alphaproteobacteria bacterium RIFCSPLOWO2_02_FULL_40_19]OFX10859.1 MAG: hypothetical protein A3G22_00335 [Alphaproteobacteria bacterium RI